MKNAERIVQALHAFDALEPEPKFSARPFRGLRDSAPACAGAK